MSKPQILIVEDEGIVATDIQKRVTRMGYDAPQISSTADEAVTQAERSHPNLVLMDIHLKGDLDGITAAQKIRSSLGIPVVFLTAFSDEDTLRRAKASEPYGYLLKPFGETELRMTIDIALQNHALAERLKDDELSAASTLASMADGVICVDANGEVVSMNPAAESLTGCSEAQAERRPIGQVLRVKQEFISQLTSEVMDGADPKGLYPLALRRVNAGTHVPIEAHVAPLRTKGRKITGAVIVIREVKNRLGCETESVEAEKSGEYFDSSVPGCNFPLGPERHRAGRASTRTRRSQWEDLLGTNLYASALPKAVVDQILTAVRSGSREERGPDSGVRIAIAHGVQRQWAHIVPSGKDEAVMVMRDITAFQSPGTLRQVAVRDLVDKEMEALSRVGGRSLAQSLACHLRNLRPLHHQLQRLSSRRGTRLYSDDQGKVRRHARHRG